MPSRAGDGSHVIETEVGRLGVGICYENLLFERLYGLFQASVDLVLQPSAAGRPKPMKPGDVELFYQMIKRSAPHHARTLGVPVVPPAAKNPYHRASHAMPGLPASIERHLQSRLASHGSQGEVGLRNLAAALGVYQAESCYQDKEVQRCICGL
jgi:hypothetical protein